MFSSAREVQICSLHILVDLNLFFQATLGANQLDYPLGPDER